MISCTDAVKQLWEYLDGALDDSDKHAVEEHLAFCRKCCGEVEFAEELRAFLASQEGDDLSEGVKDRLLRALDEM